MHSFLPIPPPFLSFTACGFSSALPVQPLAASSSSVAAAFVLAHRSLASSCFTVGTPSFALIRSCFLVCASLLALGRARVARCLPLVRLGLWLLYVSRFVGRQQSRYGSRNINPPSPICANPALNLAPFGRWTLRDKPAQRRLALR